MKCGCSRPCTISGRPQTALGDLSYGVLMTLAGVESCQRRRAEIEMELQRRTNQIVAIGATTNEFARAAE